MMIMMGCVCILYNHIFNYILCTCRARSDWRNRGEGGRKTKAASAAAEGMWSRGTRLARKRAWMWWSSSVVVFLGGGECMYEYIYYCWDYEYLCGWVGG